MRRPFIPIAAVTAAFAFAPAAGAPAAGAPTAAPVRAIAAKSCSSGYRHAVINGSHRCLRAGQFCAHAYDHRAPHRWPYTHYGYRCVKQDSRGTYHLTYR
jgi:hypothetical protein